MEVFLLSYNFSLIVKKEVERNCISAAISRGKRSFDGENQKKFSNETFSSRLHERLESNRFPSFSCPIFHFLGDGWVKKKERRRVVKHE